MGDRGEHHWSSDVIGPDRVISAPAQRSQPAILDPQRWQLYPVTHRHFCRSFDRLKTAWMAKAANANAASTTRAARAAPDIPPNIESQFVTSFIEASNNNFWLRFFKH